MAILAKRCRINRESAFSSSGRLPASFGGLLGFLLAVFEILRLLLGRSEESAESRLGAPLGATEMRGPLGPSPLSARSAVARPPGAESAVSAKCSSEDIDSCLCWRLTADIAFVYKCSEIGALVRRSGIRTNTTRFPFLFSQVYVVRRFACCRWCFRRFRCGGIAKSIQIPQTRSEILEF